MSRPCSVVFIGLAVLLTGAAPSRAQIGPATHVRGVESGDIDRAANPCEDFYAYANGAWRAAHPTPSGPSRISRRTVAREANRRQLIELLAELSANRRWRRGTIEQQLGDHFGACMNENAVESAGVTPIAPLLADIAAVKDAEGVQRLIRRLHEIAVPVAFSVTPAFDFHDPEAVVASIGSGGLGLGDRDEYLNPDPGSAAARTRYQDRVARGLRLAGMSDDAASLAASDIVALETRLAGDSLPLATAADPAATAHKVAFARLTTMAPRIEWSAYFKEAKLPRIDVNVAEPKYVERLNREFETTSVATWKAYLTWRLVESAAPSLAKPFADDALATRPRTERCLESTETVLGEPLGRKYAERYFPPAAKARVQEMAREILGVLKDDVRELAWMSAATKKEALAKLDAYGLTAGYPDTWLDHSALVIRRDAFWDNVAAARRFGVEAARKRIGARVSRTTFLLPPSSPDAYIDVQLNVMGLPAGFLQAPAFDLSASDAVNYGAIGAGMAHDFTHAIDALGRDFDAKGQARNWWTPADLEAFEKVGQCTERQYGAYEIEPGLTLDGRFVLGEALGDLAGMRLAYRALGRSMKRRPVPTIDGFTPEQQFFLAWGQYRGAAEGLDLQRRMVKSDPHPTARYRVNGPLANLPEFQAAFACRAGAPMVRPPESRCVAWWNP